MNSLRLFSRNSACLNLGPSWTAAACRNLIVMACVGWIQSGIAQPATGADAFAPGARELFSLNLAQEPLGDFAKPTSPLVSPLSGKLEVVEKDGQKMLRSSMESEFLITLPERLPEHFTLEFDLITRASGYNNYELSFEGTPTPNKSLASAYVTWRQGGVTLFGGRDAPSNLNEMPLDVQAEIEGQLAEVRVDVAGDNFAMYTNGRKIFGAPAVKFVRARVLRVGLNGVDGKQYAVHLSRLRIADASTTMPATTQMQSASLAGSRTGAGSTNTSNSGSGAVMTITGITVTVSASGMATVTWNPLPMTATYFVVRWNATDPACCNAMSPPGIPITSTVWQDGVLPLRGTYVYRVIGKTANGTYEGETQFAHGGAPTPPPGVAYPADGGIIGATSAGPPLSERTPIPVTTTPTTSGGITYTPKSEPTLTSTPPPGTIPGTTSPTVTGVTDIAPTFGGTITPTQTGSVSGGGGVLPAPSDTPTLDSTIPNYRVTLTGFVAIRQTNDDVFSRDGIGDEVFGAAAVVAWDRKANVLKSYRFVNTPDYGDLGTIVAETGRIQAGTGGSKGGIVSGNKIPSNYDPAGESIPAATNDRFPLLLWEGPLTANVDTILIVPSLWERDTDKGLFNIYKTNWDSIYKTTVLNSGAVAKQVISAPLTSVVMPDVRTVVAVGDPVSLTYKWITNTVGAGSDRPIGTGIGTAVLEYFDRVIVVTQEKVATLAAGKGLTLQLPLAEPLDPALGGMYTLYVRVERTK